jgi:hypothetical protein
MFYFQHKGHERLQIQERRSDTSFGNYCIDGGHVLKSNTVA